MTNFLLVSFCPEEPCRWRCAYQLEGVGGRWWHMLLCETKSISFQLLHLSSSLGEGDSCLICK